MTVTRARSPEATQSPVALDALLTAAGGADTSPRARHTRRALIWLLVCAAVLSFAALGLLVFLQSQLAGNVQRIPHVFTGLENRPARSTTGTAAKALNILVMGTDRRAEGATTGSAATGPTWIPGAQRTDTIMILHVDGDRGGASLISIPRDSWVDVPGHGRNKINAAFSFAGPSLAVHTVEQLTGVRIDHLAVIDWAGFEAITDVLGGVEVTVPQTVEDTRHHVVWTRGRQVLDGAGALLYVRQRYGLPGGDLDRINRQQAFVRSLIRSSIATLRGPNPMTSYDLLETMSRNVSVDDGWEFDQMRDLMLGLRALSPQDVHFITAPVRGLGREGAQSVVRLDRALNRQLWATVFADRVDDWVAANRGLLAVGAPR
jgi:LCP family protein required for cell wall assembly